MTATYTPLTDADLNVLDRGSVVSAGLNVAARAAAREIRALRAEQAETLACIRDALGLLNDRTANNMPKVRSLNAALARLRARLPQPTAEGRAEFSAPPMVDCALTNDADANDQELLGQYPDTAEGIRDAALAALTRLGWSLTTSTIEGRAE